MVSNLSKHKAELTELARVINQFKSEAVQVRLLEMLFANEATAEGASSARTAPSRGVRPEAFSQIRAVRIQPAKIHRKRKMGALSAIETLIGSGFFKVRRAISEVAAQIRTKLNLKFETNELSGPLAKLVHQGKLKRDKSVTGFYQYFA